MIFPREMVVPIRQRQRGELRQPVRRHPEFGFEMPCRFKVGEIYEAQTLRKWTVAKLREHARLCEEAAPNRARAVLAYLDEPIEAHHPKATVIGLGFQVTVMEVRRDGGAWVIRFEVGDQRHKFDRDVFMAAVIGPNSPHGRNEQDYTDKPGFALDRDAPVPPAVLERYASENGARDRERRDAERFSRPRSARVAALERAAAAGDQQAKRHLFVIDQRIEAHERGEPRSQTG